MSHYDPRLSQGGGDRLSSLDTDAGQEFLLLLGDLLLALVVGELGETELVGVLLELFEFGWRVLLWLAEGVGTDGSVGLLVHVLDVIGLDAVLDVLCELALEGVLIVLLEHAHVLGHVLTVDVVAQHVRVQSFGVRIIAGETFLRVRNVESTVRRTLHGTEQLGTGGGTLQTHIQEALERAWTIIHGLDFVEFTVRLHDTLVLVGQAQLGQHATGHQETGTVGGRPVGQTNLDTERGQFTAVRRGQHDITLDLGVDHLANDGGVGEADHETVLGRVVLVLVLDDQTLASVVVGLALSPSTVLDLVALEVRLVLDELNERHVR